MLVTLSRQRKRAQSMSHFSQFLITKQLLTEAQLERALQHRAVYGARLGTSLVELRILTVERLAECLSELHHTALPPHAWLERPKRDAVERVTRSLVERIRFIPMRLENNNTLHVAVLDPNDPATLDALRVASGCTIHPYVLPEIWMHDWLFTLFKLPRGIRHIEADGGDLELEQPADLPARTLGERTSFQPSPSGPNGERITAQGEPEWPSDRPLAHVAADWSSDRPTAPGASK